MTVFALASMTICAPVATASGGRTRLVRRGAVSSARVSVQTKGTVAAAVSLANRVAFGANRVAYSSSPFAGNVVRCLLAADAYRTSPSHRSSLYL